MKETEKKAAKSMIKAGPVKVSRAKKETAMKYKRILLKLSGEALAAEGGGYAEDEIARIAAQVKKIIKGGTDV